jgi:hypothetical protein
MTFDLQTILVQDQTFHLFNHAQKVTQLLALEYVHLTIGCVCFEQNLSCTELCPWQALDLCHNVITHRTDIEDDDA